MENGVHELKSKAEEFDTDVNGLLLLSTTNDGVETEPVTKEVEDGNDKNGGVNEAQGVIDSGNDDAVKTRETRVVSETLPVDSVEGENGGVNDDDDDEAVEARETWIVSEKTSPVDSVVSLKVIEEVSTSDSTTVDQPVVTVDNKTNEPMDFEEPEVKLVNSVEVNANTSDSAASNTPSELEANATVNDGESTSDHKGACDELNDTETDESAVGEKDAVKSESVSDEQKIHTDVSKDEANGLENNGINEDENVANADILEDVNEVNTKPVTLVLETSENGVSNSNHVNLEQTVTHEDDITEKKDVDVYKPKEKLETLSDNVLNMQNGSTVEHIQDDKKVEESSSTIDEPDNRVEITLSPEAEKSEPENHETKQDIMPVNKEQDSRPVIGVSLPTPKSATPKHDLKPDTSPVSNSKPPRAATPALTDSRPVIGVSLPAPKSATPKHDPTPNQFPVPNSKPPPAATPAPTPPSASTRPTGLGSAAPLPEPAHRVVRSQPNGTTSPPPNQVIEEPTNGEPDENDETREKLQMIRVKFLRLARRLGQTTHNVVVAQVLYRLGLAEQLRGSNGGRVGAFSFERASAMAEQLEAAGQDPLEFSCTIMVLGKTGVGKSATINSIFDEVKFGTDPFKLGTTKVQDVVGTVQGIKVRVIDTPGLHPSWDDRRKNEKILHSVKRFIQKSPPDIVLYLDRLDMQSRDSGDMHVLKSITDVFGQSIWFNAIVVLTHAASAPPDGPNGAPTAYDMFVTQRSHVVQQAIRQAAGDMRLMNPVSLVENHSACRTNPAGQRVLPNAQVWKPHLLLLSFASKILVEANMLLKLQDSPPGKLFAARTRQPPLPYILSTLLQSRPQLKLPQDQFGDDDDDVGDDVSDNSDDDEPSEYDELPPFKRLTRSQLSKLSKAQKKAYYDELEYREKLFMKKQLKDEKKRRKLMKKMADINVDNNNSNDDVEDESSGSATVPVAVQDMTLPVSFDADNPTHRYRALDSANQWLTRPVLDPHGWDHDVGYEGINVEHLLALRDKIPVSFTGQITKDKKDANLQLEVSSALKHGKSKSNSTTVAFDMQTAGKEMSYTLRSDTRFINYRKNKASVGLSGTYFGDALTGGVKFEDRLTVNKRGQIVVAGGAVVGRGDVAYGGSLEATLRDKDYPLGRFLSTVGLSVMDWHGDLALGWNAQSQIPIGRSTNLIGRVNLNNKGSGQVSVRLNSSEQLQLALAALVPVFCKLLGYYQDRHSAY